MATGGVASARKRFELHGVHEVGTGRTQWLKTQVLQAEVCWQKINGDFVQLSLTPGTNSHVGAFCGRM